MRLVRGRPETPAADATISADLLEYTRETGEPTLRVWRPHRIVAFGRRDVNRDGYERARQHAIEQDFTPVERSVGGHAVAYTGSTLAFVRTEPVANSRTGIQDRYESVTASLQEAFDALGVETTTGEPDGAFCPGSHSLTAQGKIAGLAQRVRRDAAIVSGIVVVRDHEAISKVLEPVYEALAIEFDPDATGSLDRAGGESDPERVRDSLVTALSSGELEHIHVREWPPTVRET